MAKFNSQASKILKLLQSKPWVCVEEMTKLYIVDYRRRLVDLQNRGHKLESRKCTQHTYHKGNSKEWHLAVQTPKYQYQMSPEGVMVETRLFS